MNRRTGRLVLAACALVGAGGAGAQTYPAKPVRIVIPFAPGGGSDIVGRVVAQKLTELWSQQVVIDNRPGGGGNIGATLVARAPADGYTLFFANANHTINPSLYKSLQYDADKDFAPTSLVAIVTNVLAVHPSVPARNVRELIALAKSRPGQLNFASPGSGTSSHLAGELFRTMAGIQVVHIPYKGAAPAVTDLLGGQVSFTITSLLSVMSQVKAGKLRALGVTTAARSSALPELPTIAESGLPGFEVSNWYGILAPAGTPRAVVDRIAADLARTIQVREIAEKFSAQGAEPTSNTPEQFATYIRREIAKWAKVVEASGARAE